MLNATHAETSNRCPKCGEPPRRAIIVARVWMDLYNQEKTKITKGVSCTLIEHLKGTAMSFSCGGGHKWEVPTKGEDG